VTARERGSISIAAAGMASVLALTAAAAGDLGVLLVARARTQTAADAAALAAASALAPLLGEGDDPEVRAAAAARSNGAHLSRCICSVGDAEAVVEVALIVRTRLVRAWDGATIRASARASLDPDVYSYRE
jgi:uncharacterized membrane protein